jgi:protein-L-isoaspartate(D-aspartate) O-methyltransferase
LLSDNYKLKGQRKKLVDQIKSKGITSKNVLLAINKVPRHFFFPDDFIDKAYEDIAFPIEKGQTISQPFTVAFQSQLLDIKKGDKVLEIGTGSGYQAAILKILGAEVYTIETIEKLYNQSKALFKKLGLNIHSYLGDGSKGLPQFAPFDKIIITAAAPKLADALTSQLKENGLLVAPVGNRDVQKMILVQRIGENEYKKTSHGNFNFVPLTGMHGWN